MISHPAWNYYRGSVDTGNAYRANAQAFWNTYRNEWFDNPNLGIFDDPNNGFINTSSFTAPMFGNLGRDYDGRSGLVPVLPDEIALEDLLTLNTETPVWFSGRMTDFGLPSIDDFLFTAFLRPALAYTIAGDFIHDHAHYNAGLFGILGEANLWNTQRRTNQVPTSGPPRIGPTTARAGICWSICSVCSTRWRPGTTRSSA